MKQASCLVFDLDGTLIDSLDDIANALNAALKFHNLPCHEREVVRKMVGHGLAQLVNTAIEDAELRSTKASLVLQHLKASYSAQPFVHSKPYPGLVELITDLKKAGHILAVLSNKADAIAKPLVEHFFPKQFDLVKGEILGQARKPDPTSLISLIETLKQELRLNGDVQELVRDCIVIGDSEADIQTAHKAGAKALGVLWGFREEAALRAAGADQVFADIESLRQRLGL